MFKQVLLPSFVIASLFLSPGNTKAELAGSSHDFSMANWADGELCLPCHNAHNEIFIEEAAPLWNRDSTTTNYRVYTSVTFQGQIHQPGSVSKLCLSCHDGITALDSFGGEAGSTFLMGINRLGNDPSEHHPISFVFDSSLALEDDNLRDPGTSPSGFGSTISEDLLLNSRVECISCHDVHNKNNFLSFRDSGMGRDGLCMTCHLVVP